MKVALVHDQLQEFGGAERVLVSLMKIFPNADIFTSLYNPKSLGIHAKEFKNKKIHTSWADKFFLTKRFYSPLRFITPLIWESLDLSQYDLVISSSGSYMSKGVITRPETLHICYLHHPPRYLYYYETAREWKKYALIRAYAYWINNKLRMWDYLSSQRPDFIIANSIETKKRADKFYRRDASVIYPPVKIPTQITNSKTKDYYITVSRLARAKHIDIVIKAANQLKIKLKIIGSGRDYKFLKSMAGPTIEFLGHVTDNELEDLYSEARAFLFASVDEEFGIAPVEALGRGLPVISFASGGTIEYIEEDKNGYLYNTLSPKSLSEKIGRLEKLEPNRYQQMRSNARKTAEKFSEKSFTSQIKQFVREALSKKRII